MACLHARSPSGGVVHIPPTAEPAPRLPHGADLLRDVASEFSAAAGLDELLSSVVDRATDAVDAQGGSLWMREDGGLVCRSSRVPDGGHADGPAPMAGTGLISRVAGTAEPGLITDPDAAEEQIGSGARSAIAAPLVVAGQVIGVIQVLNKRTPTGRFDDSDRTLLTALASIAGLALRGAQLLDAARHASDSKALLQIVRELTSTVEVDRLLLSVVNLGSQAVAYERAAIGLADVAGMKLAAVSGQEQLGLDREDERQLTALLAHLSQHDGVAYVPDVNAANDPATSLRAHSGDYLQRRGVRGLWLAPLQDEHGRLGALYMESGSRHFLGRGGLEAAGLLASQVAVSLRTAQSRAAVPFIRVLAPIAEWRRRAARVSGHRTRRRLTVAAVLLVALVVIPWQQRITAHDSRLVPSLRTPVRATVSGVIADVTVNEGDAVGVRHVLATLRDAELELRLREATTARVVAEQEAAAARAGGDQSGAQVAQLQAGAAEQRRAILRGQMERAMVRAPVAGVILTPRPHERVGEWLRSGETFVVLGRTDQLWLESRVAQQDIERVHAGQAIRLRVPALPGYTFVGRVTRIAPQADSSASSGEPTFVVRSELRNPRGLLRPGMAAKAKIVGPWRPIGYVVLRPFVRWTQMRFWR